MQSSKFSKMKGINVFIFRENEVWDTFFLTSTKCLTCDTAFLGFKNYLKTTVFGLNLAVFECGNDPCSSKSAQKDLNYISPLVSCNSVHNEDKVSYSWDCQVSKVIRYNRNTLMRLNGYQLSIIFVSLIISSKFRNRVIRNMKYMLNFRDWEKDNVILELVPPVTEVLDYAWGRRMEKLAYETLQLHTAMSWLSTLGGAFSALGEEKMSCAGIAGRISVHQFKIALRLGDFHTLSRCRLYLALSLMQRGKLKSAKSIIYNEYIKVKQMPEEAIDIRLLKMCQGLWAKLKYSYILKRRKKSEGEI